nr:ABC transporter permease [Acidobacteriota bacterium]
MQRLRVLIWKEFLELRLNPRLFGVVIVAPIVQLTLLGYAATTDVKDVPIVVADGDRSSASRELIQRFNASHHFSVTGSVTTVNEIEPFLETGGAWLGLVIPAGYGSGLANGSPLTVQVAADGTDASSTTVALGYATALIGEYAREIVEARAAFAPAAAGALASQGQTI